MSWDLLFYRIRMFFVGCIKEEVMWKGMFNVNFVIFFLILKSRDFM